MILRIRGYDMDISIEENQNVALCILNKALYRKIISDIESLIDGEDHNEVVIEDNDTKLDYGKDVVCLTDYFHLDLNNRQFLNLLDKKVESIIVQDPDDTLALELSYKKLIHDLQKIILDCEVDIECRDEFDIGKFLKMADLGFAQDSSNNVLEKLYSYLDILLYLCPFKLFIFVNLRSNFSNKEIQQLFKYMTYKKMKWVCIEGTNCDMIDLEIKYLIDEDLIEFPYSK